MEDIEVMTSSSYRSATSTLATEPRNHAPNSATTPIYFGVATEPFFFLSNSFPSKISVGPYRFLNAEAVYQAAKFGENPELQTEIIETVWPQDMLDKVERWGNYVEENWEGRRLAVMKHVQMLKYTQNLQLQDRLLQTGNAELIYQPDRDGFFGCGQNGHGLNHLGRILVELRSYLRACVDDHFAPNHHFDSFDFATAIASTPSIVWSANAASEPWYPRKSGLLKEITITPAIADISACANAFLHGIEHADDPWTLQVLIQVCQKRIKKIDHPRMKIFYECPDPHSSKSRTEYVPLSSENLKLSLKLDGGLCIYSFPLNLDKTLIEVYKCSVEISMPPELGDPEFDLHFILWP
ncbi:hypothetical protein CF326_g4318 [Tilletia indica]|nr:hypothetical protein CF326_g4318 [Tilletia indica]